MDMSCGVCGWAGPLPERAAAYIAWCPRCSTGLTVPPPGRDLASDGVFEAPTSYADRLGQRPQWQLEARARVAWMAKHVPAGGAVLELGAATGEFVEAAEQAGYEVVGLEPSTWAAGEAASLTSCVRNQFLADYRRDFPDKRFDAVLFFHTLEHLPDPGAFIDEAASVLKPAGVLLMEVPNAGTRSTTDDGSDWWMSSLADHVHHFRPATLERLLRDRGLRPTVTVAPLTEYGGPRPTPRDRARAIVRQHRLRPDLDLLRAVAVV